MESLRSGDAYVEGGPGGSLFSRSRRVSETSVATLFDRYDPPRALLRAPNEPSVAGCGAAVALDASGPRRVDSLCTAIESVFDDLDHDGPPVARPRFLGGFSFHHDHDPAHPWEGFPAGWFFLPRVQLVGTETETWLTVSSHGSEADPGAVERRLDRAFETLTSDSPATVTSDSPATATSDSPATTSKDSLANGVESGSRAPPGIEERTYTTPRESWQEQVSSTIDRIGRGDISKVVLAQSLSVTPQRAVSPLAVLDRLDDGYPDCYRFLFEPTDRAAFLGATPERLVSLVGRQLETEAIAGSTGRGDTDDEDDWLESELRASEKDRHEHDLVVETITEHLEPFATEVETGDLTVRQLATVQHLQTPIRATLADDHHVLRLIEALHPTPAVGGHPPTAACTTIREAERFDRGWYAAPVGWIDADGDGTFAIAIRSAVVGQSSVRLFAGAGIVADSVPEREWDEVQLKYRPILDALE